MRLSFLLTALIALLATPAWAKGSDPREDARRVRTAATILLSEDPDDITQDSGRFRPWIAENMRFDRRGLKYSRRFGDGADRVVLRVKGPLLEKRRFGLTFEVRF